MIHLYATSRGLSEMIWWFANRGTGVVLVAVLTLSTALGVFATVRAGSPRWPRFATQALHRNVSLLAAALLVVHIVTAVVDEYVDLSWWDAFWPMTGKYAAKERLPLALGSIALNLLIVVIATSLLRHRLTHTHWRGIHLLTYAAWAAGVLHGYLIGTDSNTTWSLAVTVVSVFVVVAAGVIRLATFANERRRDATATGALDVTP